MKELEEKELFTFQYGILQEEYQYHCFKPSKINYNWNYSDSSINNLLEKSNKILGEINAFSYLIPNINLFIKMHIMKEANTSSKIEGTKTEIDDILMKEEEVSPEKRDDWEEVHKYIDAINETIQLLDKYPLTINTIIRKAHKILLSTGRGERKLPGEIRNSQNWIGGSTPNNASFVPPHERYLPELIKDLDDFINENESLPNLIKIAMIHYQFETLHPFLDGNGRVGRLLITLYLVSKDIIKKPSLYLSYYLEKNRDEYYKKLTNIRENNDMHGWIIFFLEGIVATGESTVESFIGIIKLQQEMNEVIHSFGSRAEKVNKIINAFYESPISSIKEITEKTKIPDKTLRNIFNELEEKKIIKEITKAGRNKLYVLEKYLSLFN